MSSDSSRKERFKRPRYAARACKECKRRKVKCNGETPCLHCDRYEVQCLYPTKNVSVPTERSSDIEMINEKLGWLSEQVSILVARDGFSEQGDKPRPLLGSASICSPRSNRTLPSPAPASQFLVGQLPRDVRKLRGSDDSACSHGTVDVTDDLSVGHTSVPTKQASSALGGLAVTCHPLLAISQAEALRLIDVYEDECGSVYPLIDIGHLRYFAANFYASANASREPATWRTFQVDQSSKGSLHTLEIVLAIGLVIEGGGTTDLASALVDELEAEIDHRPSGVSVDIPFAEILTLMSLYQFYREEEVLAWRTIGLAARIALELGLHLHDPPFSTFQSTRERERANRLFWCIYCLDKRWSLGTGLPFALQEADIDPSLPEPHDPHPYLFTSMIAYSRIGSQILKASSGASHLRQFGTKEDMAFLTYQVQQWYSSLDSELRIEPGQELALKTLSPARNRLRVLHYLRRNQLRMLIHRGALFTTASIKADPQSAKTAVDLAKDTITLLDQLRNTSDIYSSHPVCFNYFLYSALTVILLAAYRAQAQFHEYCREEFHVALDLIGGVSAKSSVARKLWKIIKHLKIIGPETGILPYMDTQQDQSRQVQVAQPQLNNSADRYLEHTNNTHLTEEALNVCAMNGFPSSIPYGDPGLFAGDHAVDATLLSSELSDLFQAIEPTGFEQTPSQVVGALPTFQAAHNFSRSVWNVL
ncbi:uncharacterized protein PV07_00455 [Cladophialophora immunda]|uniref:Zn(2)-C6 fungal-type domain-containing protein n=1 Tax=Cladophialophora immunda TaxID=569365 RepID=A0A0D2DD24_9EURO|nr:uncharacterized protein PV07_00455 [Cladophialophora immunda]KIW33619.1 hypothetical protein PV07_00455 [Cladophialophora immunda]OQV04192.1 Fungal specific transcription factor domain-containing protein [Cladophialophora immunda]